jgi:hypothetical protein
MALPTMTTIRPDLGGRRAAVAGRFVHRLPHLHRPPADPPKSRTSTCRCLYAQPTTRVTAGDVAQAHRLADALAAYIDGLDKHVTASATSAEGVAA